MDSARSAHFKAMWADPVRAERMLIGLKKATKALKAMSEFDKATRIWRSANSPRNGRPFSSKR